MSARLPAEAPTPVEVAEQAIADYVADSYECLAQIEMAKRRLADIKERVPLALGLVANQLTPAERIEVFAGFYWDAVDLSCEPVATGLGYSAVNTAIRQIPVGLTGVPCLDCGNELTATSRFAAQEIRRGLSHRLRCSGCERAHREASYRAWDEREAEFRQARSRRQAALKSMRYADYLRSPEWQVTRARALKRSGYRCQLCGANQWTTLDVHHSTYERRGHELPADVLVLCRQCHGKHHTELPETQP